MKCENPTVNDSSDESEDKTCQCDLVHDMIIDHQGIFSVFWRTLDIIACMFSSYIYLWFAVFDIDHKDEEVHHYHETFMYSTQIFFTISMYTKFVTDYIPDGETVPERHLKTIALRYLHSQDFLIDLVALFPMTLFIESKFWFAFKTIRIINGIKIFNIRTIVANIKARSTKKRELLIKHDATFAEDQINNNNKIEKLVYINYTLRIIKLIVLLFNVSFFVGMYWLMFCDLTFAGEA